MRACTFVEAVIVGLGVAIDASIASASLALDGALPLPIAALMAFTHFILVWLGNLAGRKGLVLRGLALKIVPAAILFVLGFMRLPFVPV
jgi:putative Mn2+ efflux pump MntP